MCSTNMAIYAAKNGQFLAKNFPIATPDDKEVQIKVICSGVNPADIRHPRYAGLVDSIIGDDFCGRVTQTRSTKFKVGDIVAGYTPPGLPRPYKYGTHQAFLCCPEDMCFHVPPSMPHEHAAALTVVAMTAADTLYNLFSFPLPTESRRQDLGPLLIWGGSTSVGVCTIQLARESGCFPIFVTASPERHETLRKLGATACFDYLSPKVVMDIQEATVQAGFQSIRYAFDAVGTKGRPSSAQLLSKCASKDTILVSAVGSLTGKFKMPLACKNIDVTIKPFSFWFKITLRKKPDEHWRAWKALTWITENYGQDQKFVLPQVRVFEGSGEEVIDIAEKVAIGKGGFGKIVVKQPMNNSGVPI
ncbi:uncharacterized protein N7496_006601 [Penicillium cataractarum]|uniref:Enoyl reductase (ER) domain-containing protein n=1 Tax=Penicillium cataractarum TaxID=2100454 RepID=A0A9W9V7K0_9EURO|nr:uncharacterized protein N7496_006601 [Penicillium cataractarum]KAJ5370509.1 hypothetical protein N7496_006601 [Penicillium cataractarum]